MSSKLSTAGRDCVPRRGRASVIYCRQLLVVIHETHESHYGIGYSHKFNLRVNDEGAKTVRELKLQCEESDHYLCDVEILSKMGDQYFLRVGGTTDIILPKSDVVSIRRLDSVEGVERAEH